MFVTSAGRADLRSARTIVAGRFSVKTLVDSGMGFTVAPQILSPKLPTLVTLQRTVFPTPPTFSRIGLEQGRDVMRMLFARTRMLLSDGNRTTESNKSVAD